MGSCMGFQIYKDGGNLSFTISNPAVFSILSKIIHFSAYSELSQRGNSKQSDPTSTQKSLSGLKGLDRMPPVTREQTGSLTFGITVLAT